MAMDGQGGRGRRWAVRVLLALTMLGVGIWLAFQLSPWPSVLLIRWAFDRGAAETSQALRKHLPAGVGLLTHAEELNIDTRRIVLAGDSAGAQIAAEVANLTTSPVHAQRMGIVPALASEQLAGMLLYCGPYDAGLVQWDSPFAGFMRTVLWSYLGKKDFRDDPRLDVFSVSRHVTPAFPPSFVSAGNADPLEPHSRALVAALNANHVKVEGLFFPKDYTPALPHEYQFNLDIDAGRQALQRSVAFLTSLERPPPPAHP